MIWNVPAVSAAWVCEADTMSPSSTIAVWSSTASSSLVSVRFTAQAGELGTSLVPLPFTRDSRTDQAWFISADEGGWPRGVWAWSTTSVPLDRSSPSLTLNCSCHCRDGGFPRR